MRVALVSDWCLPRFGGLELQLIDLARALRVAGHEPEIITSTPGDSEIDGIPVHRLGGFRFPYFGFAASPTQFRQARELIDGRRYDVVHVHSGIIAPLAYGVGRLSATLGVPTAYTFHSVYDYLEPALHALSELSGASRFPIAWSAVSRHVAGETSRALSRARVDLLPNGIDRDFWRARVDLLPNGIDRDFWRARANGDAALSPRPRDAGGDRTFRLVTVMRVQVRKRPRDLFPILEMAQHRVGPDRPITLDIVGDGPERGVVELLARRTNGRVRLHGRQSREWIRDLFAASHAFILPTRMESFGIAALEAMCAGLPVIARRPTGVEDFVIHGQNGLLGSSIEELGEAVATLASDESLRASIAANNRAARPPYSWPEVVNATLAQYARAAALQ